MSCNIAHNSTIKFAPSSLGVLCTARDACGGSSGTAHHPLKLTHKQWCLRYHMWGTDSSNPAISLHHCTVASHVKGMVHAPHIRPSRMIKRNPTVTCSDPSEISLHNMECILWLSHRVGTLWESNNYGFRNQCMVRGGEISLCLRCCQCKNRSRSHIGGNFLHLTGWQLGWQLLSNKTSKGHFHGEDMIKTNMEKKWLTTVIKWNKMNC